MKDASHHLKHLQKKVMKSAKRENPRGEDFFRTENFQELRRPKTIPNKKKAA